MSKSFSSIKKHLDLTDFFTFGKYQNCRVDSIVDMDYNYISFLSKKGVKFSPKVLELVERKIVAYYTEDIDYDSVPFEDMPF